MTTANFKYLLKPLQYPRFTTDATVDMQVQNNRNKSKLNYLIWILYTFAHGILEILMKLWNSWNYFLFLETSYLLPPQNHSLHIFHDWQFTFLLVYIYLEVLIFPRIHAVWVKASHRNQKRSSWEYSSLNN